MNATNKITRASQKAAQREGVVPWLLLGKGFLRGIALSLLTLVALCFAAAGVAYASDDPDALTMPLSLGVLALTALACGFGTAHTVKGSALLCGILSGAGLLFVWFFLSCFLPDSMRGQWGDGMTWGLRGGVMVFGVLGAMLATGMPRRRIRRPNTKKRSKR